MNITITPQPLAGKLNVISSKSLSHRYMIAAGLADGTSILDHVLESDDIEATKTALKAFGVHFDGHKVIGGQREIVQREVNVKESGSTLRFMIPIYLLDLHPITITGEGRLPQRPLHVYQTLFKDKHITFKQEGKDQLPLTLQGKIKGGHYKVLGDVSSQFISGLLFALPLRREDSVIELTTPLASKGYVDLTLSVLKQFGIHILRVDQYFYIKGSQRYQPCHATIEGDYSQAAFWIVAGLLGESPIELSHLSPDSLQGDKAIIEIVNSMGGHIETLDNGYKIYPSQTKGVDIDLKDIPDLGPILMVLAARSKGQTTFYHCDRLKIKESDRLVVMIETLKKLGVQVSLDGDTVMIEGQETFKGHQTLSAHYDHRIVMAIAIATIHADGPITIEGAEAVRKSYPTFFKDYQALGGAVNEH